MAEATPTTRRADWLELVQRDLKGADFEKRLVGRTVEGLRIEPLYDAETVDAVRLAKTPSLGRTGGGHWAVGLRVDAADPAVAARHLALAGDGGLGRVTLVVATETDGRGVVLPTADALSTLLAPIDLTHVQVAFDAGLGGLSLLRAAQASAAGQSCGNEVSLDGGVDIFGTAYRDGGLPISFEGALAAVCHEVERYDAFTNIRIATLSSVAVNNAGGGLVQELAFVVCGLLEYLRAAERAGVTLVNLSKRLSFTLATGRDFFWELAKIRALRRMAARVFEACGVDPALTQIPVHAVTAERTWSSVDPWTNLLRGTVATVAAATGGADSVTVLPLDSTLGPVSDFGQRLARNTQLVLQHESHVGVVDDPGAGSWAIEAETDALASSAWALLQEIEAEGGLIATLRSGAFTKRVVATAGERQRRIARRQEAITGVSEFADLGGRMPPPGAAGAASDANFGHWPGAMLEAGAGTSAEVLEVAPILRDALPFESLRARAEADGHPTAFLATSGPLASWKARGDWTTNALAAGGFASVVGEPSDDVAAIAQQFQASGARFAVIVAPDDRWDGLLGPCAAALAGAGARAVVLAGRYSDTEGLGRLGIAMSVFAGCDLVALLESLHDVTGGAQ